MAEHGHTVLCFGPPGTGKTTWLGGRVKGTVKARWLRFRDDHLVQPGRRHGR